MRCWRARDGNVLVERDPGAGTGTAYAVFDGSGAIVRVYEPWGSSDAEYLYHMTYAVEGDCMIERTHMEADSGREGRWSHVVLGGLVVVTAAESPVARPVEPAARRFTDDPTAAWEEQRRREALRLRSVDSSRGFGPSPWTSSC
jgi:hypothetical protein